MIQTHINDPIEGMINADKAMRFPPWKMVKTSFALVGQHFLLFLNLWGGTIKIALIFMVTIGPIIAPIVLFQMLLMVYAGLAFRFLYQTRLQGEGSETIPSPKPVQTLKTGLKGRHKPTRSNTP